MDLIDYAEQQGLANFQWQQRVNETTRQESNLTLGFLFTGGAACIAWALSQLTSSSPHWPLAIAVIITSLWLFALAAAVQFKCLAFKPALPPANHPLNLYKPEFDTLGIREINLHHMEDAILYAIRNGQKKAKALVKIRFAACATPLVFLAAWYLAALRCG
jgi:hypothetical protein